MLGNPYAMQLAQNNLDAPTSHINFAEMGADNLLGIDMSMHNSQVSTSIVRTIFTGLHLDCPMSPVFTTI